MIIAIDFDGTIVEHRYPEIGKLIPFSIEVLKRLQEEEGHQLILWTVREGKLLKEAVDFCEKYDLNFYAINKNNPEETESIPRKLTADLFIDDRNLGGLPDWGVIYKIIKSGGNSLYNFSTLLDESEGVMKKERKNFFIRLGEAIDKAKGKSY